jgi:hypothetical protein
MSEKKRTYEMEVMALPPLRMMLGEIPSPDPEGRGEAGRKPRKADRELAGTVKRIIAHLKDEKE